MALRFVHAADLHLGSPFVGLGKVDGDVAELVRTATESAFHNLVDVCIARDVDFLLVAGDVYDGADHSLRAQLAFRDGLRRLTQAGIRAYVVHGNHDPLDGWSAALQWPPGVHIFQSEHPEPVPFARDGTVEAVIHGVSFPRREVKTNLARRFSRQDGDAFQIGLLHCNVGDHTGHAPYAPCSVDDLAGTGLDYWALGHVHTRQTLNGRSPLVAYPGNAQGRHINESGPRGCLLVEVDGAKQVQTQFLAVDAIRWVRESVDIGPLVSEEDLLSALATAVERVQEQGDGRMCLCRLALTGRGPLHRLLHHPEHVQDVLAATRSAGRSLVPLVWVDALDVQTRPAADLDALHQAPDLLGDCLRLADEYGDDGQRLLKLKEHLGDLFANPRVRKYLAEPAAEDLLAILRDAEALCVDRLLGDDR